MDSFLGQWLVDGSHISWSLSYWNMTPWTLKRNGCRRFMFGVLFHPLLLSRFENVHAISSNHILEPLSVLSYIYTCYCDAPLLESLCRFLHSLIRNGCLQLWIMREYAIMISSLLFVISHALLEKLSFIIYRWFHQQNGQNWPIFAHIKTSICTHLLKLSNFPWFSRMCQLYTSTYRGFSS